MALESITINNNKNNNKNNNNILRPYPGELVPEETLTHPPSWSSSNLYQLFPSTTIHSILLVQITCLAIFLHINNNNNNINTRHRASTSMYSLTFRVHVTTPAVWTKWNGACSRRVDVITGGGESSLACVVCMCGIRAVGLADYRWALPRISIVLP